MNNDNHAPRLNPTDQQRVNSFVSSGINTTDRKPFRPWRLILLLSAGIVALGLAARLIGYLYLP